MRRVRTVARAYGLAEILTGDFHSGGPLQRNLFRFGAEIIPEPGGRVPVVVPPHERVSVDAHTTVTQKRNHRIGRRAAPVRLFFRMRAGVPEIFSILVTFLEARRIRIQFKRTPVKRHRRRIEECSVKFLVPVVPLLLAQLVEVENVGSKEEVVGLLAHCHSSTVWRIDLNRGVGLAVLLDIRIDLFLDVIVPYLPLRILHDSAVNLEFSK